MPTVLVTGSAGLIGSESVKFFAEKDFQIVGIDNNMRQYFFGREANTEWNRRQLEETYGKQYIHYNADIRNDEAIRSIFNSHTFDLIIHTAAQPSHDWAVKEPYTDFGVNAQGTHTILENFRKYAPQAAFIFTSTNKVYGDRPNELPLIELDKRYELPKSHRYFKGIDESMSIDDTKHSIFGASKVAADILVQEYGKYFNLHTAVFRGGCLTGPAHSGTQLHGFLAYLIKCIATGKKYSIFGYKGKQVRDNIHSYDLVNMFWHYYQNPRIGEVYNAGGGRNSNVSMLEAIEKSEKILGKKAHLEYIKENRIGDHIWYISDISKFKNHYPSWDYQYDSDKIIEEICWAGHFANETRGSSSYTMFHTDNNHIKTDIAFLAAHTSAEFGPVQALRTYLTNHTRDVHAVEHSLVRTNSKLLRKSFLDIYYDIRYFLHVSRDNKVTFYAINPINGLSASLLKMVGKRFSFVYYTTDYSSKRFVDPILNTAFHLIDRLNALVADYVWAPTSEVAIIRKDQGVKKDKIKLVRSGIKKSDFHEKTRSSATRILIDGYVSKEQNIIRAVDSFSRISSQFPSASLSIILGPVSRKKLDEKIKKMKLQNHIHVLESKPHALSIGEYKDYDIGLCLMKTDKTDTAIYKDPSEIKSFWAAGIPTIVNKPYSITHEIDDAYLGISIDNTNEALDQALITLLGNKRKYKEFSNNALSYSKQYMWDDIFDVATTV